MILDAEATTHLKPWLVRTLEPICDAEPGALADYILALLKHNVPETELRQELNAQLEEFLEKETSSFIETLFTALRTKSYLPYSAPSPPAGTDPSSISAAPDGGIPIPLDGLVPSSESDSPDRSRKRSLEYDDGSDLRPAKGPRLYDDGQYQRPGRGGFSGRGERGGRMMISGRADYMDGGMAGAMDMSMGGGMMNGRGAYRPPDRVRGICRDYHNNGYCARGAFCKYSHGDDAVIPGQLFPMNGVPGAAYGPMMPGTGDMAFPMAGGANAPYNPHERMDMRPMVGANMGLGAGRLPHTRTPMLPRHGDVNGIARKPGELPVIQDLTPRAPEDEVAPQAQAMGSTNGAMPGVEGPVTRDLSLPMNPMAMGPMVGMQNAFPRQRNGPMAPKGTFRETPSFRGERRQDKTLVVEKIPEDKLSLGAINDWFKRFGTVTNVAVDASGGKALVSFSTHEEAYAAWKSEDAVFGNRFVKVFWHRPMEGHGQVGARMLAASAPLVAKVSGKEPPQPPKSSAPTPSTSTSTTPRKATPSSAVSALAEKQKLLEKQIAEQKSLMERLSTASPEEKKEIMARLRKLNEEMKPPTPGPSSAAQPSSTAGSRGSTPRTEDQVQQERARLDKELEMHAVTNADGDGEENTEELKARLEKLKAEAASLGISTDGPEGAPSYGGGYRPYRGRGRGRGFFRGAMRGGPPRTSMKLDNRPKKLLVKGASAEQLQGVRDWYETTGQVESVDVTDSGDILVSFKSRAAAEQGMAKGANIPIVGAVQVTWYSGQPSSTSNAQKASPAPADAPVASEEQAEPRPPSPAHDDMHMHMPEEEMVSGRWGGGDDAEDEFGML